MSVADEMWDAIATVIRMNDKVERMAAGMKMQQERIENLSERVIRLERGRLAAECAKLDPAFEKALAEEGLGHVIESWPAC